MGRRSNALSWTQTGASQKASEPTGWYVGTQTRLKIANRLNAYFHPASWRERCALSEV